jgi:hypothetical protein
MQNTLKQRIYHNPVHRSASRFPYAAAGVPGELRPVQNPWTERIFCIDFIGKGVEIEGIISSKH